MPNTISGHEAGPLQDNAALEPGAGILGGAQGRDGVPSAAGEENGVLRLDLKAPLVPLLGVDGPLRAVVQVQPHAAQLADPGRLLDDALDALTLQEARGRVLVAAADANLALALRHAAEHGALDVAPLSESGEVVGVEEAFEAKGHEGEVDRVVERAVEEAPETAVVDGLAGEGGVVLDHVGGQWDGLRLEGLEEVVDGLLGVLDGGAVLGEGALFGTGVEADVEELGESLVDVGHGLPVPAGHGVSWGTLQSRTDRADLRLVVVLVRVEHAVEHDAVYPVREHGRERGAECGSVGHA